MNTEPLDNEPELPPELQNIFVKTNIPTVEEIRLLQQYVGSYVFNGEDGKTYIVGIWDNAIFVTRIGDEDKKIMTPRGVAVTPSIYSYQIVNNGVLCDTYANPTEYDLGLKRILGI